MKNQQKWESHFDRTTLADKHIISNYALTCSPILHSVSSH